MVRHCCPQWMRVACYMALSCSHTNMFLRCVADGVSSDHPTLSVDGKLSMEMLELKDKEFAKAVRGGLTWTVLSHRVRSRFPEFLTLVQSARNVAQQVAHQEHEMQVMMRVHRRDQKAFGQVEDL